MEDINYGSLKIHIDDMIKNRGISKNKLCNIAQIQRTQLNNYCKGDIQRLDIAIITRLCYALECNIYDIIEYVPPIKK